MRQKYFKLLIHFFTLFLITTYLHAEDSIKIMPLGDSITYGNIASENDDPRPSSIRTGYRNHLWYMLQGANFSADFVGSDMTGQDIVPPFDSDNEGHVGWTSYNIAENVHDYMSTNNPDIILLHIGTNDLDTSITGVAEILNQINLYELESGETVRVLIALIIDTRSPNEIIQDFNDNLRKLVNLHMLIGDKVTLVDMYKGAGLMSSDYGDFIHPNDNGYNKMATVWFNALMAPYTPELYTFPATLVTPTYITHLNINETTKSVVFTTEVPDSGIIF